MEAAEVIDIARDAIIVLLQVSGPIMMVGLAIGLVVSLIQSITHIQEMTLAFVPKILAIFASLLLFAPFMISQLVSFMERIAQRIAQIG
jgi:flagellar biosynthesis protein FliQ